MLVEAVPELVEASEEAPHRVVEQGELLAGHRLGELGDGGQVLAAERGDLQQRGLGVWLG